MKAKPVPGQSAAAYMPERHKRVPTMGLASKKGFPPFEAERDDERDGEGDDDNDEDDGEWDNEDDDDDDDEDDDDDDEGDDG